MMFTKRQRVLMALFGTFSGHAAVASGCLDYGPVQLSGTLVRQTYAGPPDYESVTKGDAPIVIWVLSLERTLCVSDSRGRYRKEWGTREVQIQPSADQQSRYPSLLGAKVTVAGVLAPGGANDDKRLVIAATEISASK